MAEAERTLLDEQIRYYRRRAAEYDATSGAGEDPFRADLDHACEALRAFDPRGRVLELAAGTGQWTGLLAEYADELTATDASSEMLELNAAKVDDPRVRYRVADAFAMAPDPAWDVVFFGFFLSHVPSGRFDAFWRVVADLLAPGGRAFFVDEADHGIWDEDWADRAGGIVRRTLKDGSVHRAVKVLWRPPTLRQHLERLGWRAQVEGGGPFYWGSATPAHR